MRAGGTCRAHVAGTLPCLSPYNETCVPARQSMRAAPLSVYAARVQRGTPYAMPYLRHFEQHAYASTGKGVLYVFCQFSGVRFAA